MKTIGLTGGIGSGKSTVAHLLEELGAVVIQADLVAHEIYRPGTEGWRRVTDAFGKDLVNSDGTIDRKKLAAIVFQDHGAMQRLNAMLHPLVTTEIQRRITSWRDAGSSPGLVLEAALLIEAGWVSFVEEVWLVVAHRTDVIDRVHRQRGLAAEEIGLRISAQLSDAERRPFAHVTIENTGSLDELRERVRAEWARIAGAS